METKKTMIPLQKCYPKSGDKENDAKINNHKEGLNEIHSFFEDCQLVHDKVVNQIEKEENIQYPPLHQNALSFKFCSVHQ